MSGPRPYTMKKQTAPQVYTPDDYDERGNLIRVKKIPLADGYEKTRGGAMYGIGNKAQVADDYAPPPTPVAPPRADQALSADEEKLQRMTARSTVAGPQTPFETPQIVASHPAKHRLGKNKFDVRTPPGMSDTDEQYVAVVRTIENRHPDEDRILQKYALQYVARQNGTYNPIEDPPVVLSDLTPTSLVVIDRVFSRDEAGAEAKVIGKYVKKLAGKTDLDVVPVHVGKPFHVPLNPLTTFKYKDKVLDQIMSEFYESREESASEILSRVEADREGRDAEKPKWHVFDGLSDKGALGNNEKNFAKSWGDRVDEELGEDLEEELGEDLGEDAAEDDWKVVKAKKPVPRPAVRKGGMRK